MHAGLDPLDGRQRRDVEQHAALQRYRLTVIAGAAGPHRDRHAVPRAGCRGPDHIGLVARRDDQIGRLAVELLVQDRAVPEEITRAPAHDLWIGDDGNVAEIGDKRSEMPGERAFMARHYWRLRSGPASSAAIALRSNDKAKALADVVNGRGQTVVRRGGGGTVLQQQAVIAAKIGILQRAQHALVGVDAGEHQRGRRRDCAGCCRARYPESPTSGISPHGCPTASTASSSTIAADQLPRSRTLAPEPGSASPRPTPAPLGL